MIGYIAARAPGSRNSSRRGSCMLLCVAAFAVLSHVLTTMNASSKTSRSMLQESKREVTVDTIAALKERIKSLEDTLKSTERQGIILDFDTLGSNNETFCAPWELNLDKWWTHHVDWHVSYENSTHYCFSLMEDQEKAAVFRRLYDVQFHGDCSNVTTKRMWSSGYGADFLNVVDGLNHAFKSGIPMQVYCPNGHWHYAAKKDGSRPVCDKKNMYCYFLDMSTCDPNPERAFKGGFLTGADFKLDEGIGHWFLEYATRPQTWLRHEIFKFIQKVNVVTPCTVIHVRRSDIVLHNKASRRYHEIDEYVEAVSNDTKNILLLTDDDNAIAEANAKFGNDYNWMYIDRPRHKGSEGGWENQIPSDDPKLEVVVLMSIFRLVKKCSTLIHAYSNLSTLLRGEMIDAIGKDKLITVNLDLGDPHVFSEKNALSANISKAYA